MGKLAVEGMRTLAMDRAHQQGQRGLEDQCLLVRQRGQKTQAGLVLLAALVARVVRLAQCRLDFLVVQAVQEALVRHLRQEVLVGLAVQEDQEDQHARLDPQGRWVPLVLVEFD